MCEGDGGEKKEPENGHRISLVGGGLNLSVASFPWHEQIGDPTIADSILDRIVHNAYRVELNGESMRKKKGRKPEDGGEE